MISNERIDLGFTEIALSLSDMRRLSKSSTKGVPIEKCETLIVLKLVAEERKHVPGYMGTPTGIAKITERGRLYLSYARRDYVDRVITRVVAIWGAITGTVALGWQIIDSIYLP